MTLTIGIRFVFLICVLVLLFSTAVATENIAINQGISISPNIINITDNRESAPDSIPSDNVEINTFSLEGEPFSASITDVPNSYIIVVHGKKSALRDVWAPVTLLSREEIVTYPDETIADKIQQEPSIHIINQSSPGLLATTSLRGMSSNKISYVWNDVPLNSPSSGTYDINKIPFFSFEQVEILKTGFSNLYGSYASGGVLYFRSLDPEVKKARLLYNLSVSNELRHSADLLYNAPFQDNAYYWVAYSKGFGSDQRPNSDYYKDSIAVQTKVYVWDNFEWWSFIYSYKGDTGVPGPIPAENTKGYFSNHEEVSSLTDHQTSYDSIISTKLKYYWEDHSDINLQLYTTQSKIDSKQKYQDTSNPLLVIDYDALFSDEATRTGERIIYNYVPQSFYSLQLGLEGWQDAFVSAYRRRNMATDGIARGKDHAQLTQSGIWADTVFSFEYADIILGTRLDDQTMYDQVYSPRTGLVFKFGEFTRLRLSRNKSFRAPSLNDLYYQYYGNPELEPETSENEDIEFSINFPKSITLTTAAFNKRIDKQIVSVPSTNGYYYAENLEETAIQGNEYGISWYPIDFVRISAGYMELHGTELFAQRTYWNNLTPGKDLGDHEIVERKLTHVPAIRKNAALEYLQPKDYSLKVEYIYVGERINYYPEIKNPFNNELFWEEKILDAYDVTNIYSTKFLTDFLSVYFIWKNINNKKFKVQFGNDLKDQDYPGEPSSFMIGFRGEF